VAERVPAVQFRGTSHAPQVCALDMTPQVSTSGEAAMRTRVGNTDVVTIRGDITEQALDAIVNAANDTLLGGGGVDGAIHRRGGPAILEACREIRRTQYPDVLPTGEAVLTTAGNLPAQFVIHTVGPVWQNGESGESELLANAYRNSLERAREKGLRTLAFPSISTGVYGYPISKASTIAIETVRSYIREHPSAFDEIRFVLFSERDLETYQDGMKNG
jgi:O-acetyl-ADP-ribose deacetylase (regulator of RNase III)